MLISQLHKFKTLNCPGSETGINLIIKQIAFLRPNRFLCGLKDFATSESARQVPEKVSFEP